MNIITLYEFFDFTYLPVRIHGDLIVFWTERYINRLRLVERTKEHSCGAFQPKICIRMAIKVKLTIRFTRTRRLWAY